MKVEVDPKICISCGACIAVCPNSAITMKNDKAFIDQKKCKKCQTCVKICPVEAIKVKN